MEVEINEAQSVTDWIDYSSFQNNASGRKLMKGRKNFIEKEFSYNFVIQGIPPRRQSIFYLIPIIDFWHN